MRLRFIFISLVTVLVASAVLALCEAPECRTAMYFCWGVAAALLAWLWVGVVRPVRVAARGMELLRGRELNNRLAKVGEPGADRIVEVYNDLMSRLSEESMKLQEKNYFLNLLIEASPTGIAVMDFDGKITMVNAAFVTMASARDRQTLVGHRLDELPGELMAAAAGVPEGESRTLRISDMQVYRCRRLSFMERGFRMPFVMIESLTDEVRRAEKEAYGKIIRTISHEVNNSIGGVNTFLEVIADSEDMDADFREVAESCRERNMSLSAFLKGYTDIVKLPDPELAEMDISGMLRGMMPFLQVMGNDRVVVEILVPEEKLMIVGDEVMLQQVVVNIVKNGVESAVSACEESDTDGRVEVRLHRDRHDVVLEVDDTGKGVSADVTGKLFTPFFTTKPSGQGLGLTFSGNVLSAHRCRFSLRPLPESCLPFTTRFSIRFSSAK